MQYWHDFASICKTSDNKTVIVSGGAHNKTVEQYVLETNQWKTLPDLRESRQHHASCVIANTVYVFMGMKDNLISVKSIESLKLGHNRWQFFAMPKFSSVPLEK